MSCSHRIVSCSPAWFDPSIFDVMLRINHAHHLILIDERVKLDRIADVIQQQNATWLQATPCILEFLSHDLRNDIRLHSLSVLLSGGESLSLPLARSLLESSRIQLFNLYGFTESSIWSSVCHITPSLLDSVTRQQHQQQQLYACPIAYGEFLCNTELEICAETVLFSQNVRSKPRFIKSGIGQVTLAGRRADSGELLRCFMIDSNGSLVSLSPFESGDFAFVDAENSLVFFAGRKDNTFKLMGKRISIEEIQSAVENCFQFRLDCRVIVTNLDKTPEIVLFVRPPLPVEFSELPQVIARLPSHMRPSQLLLHPERFPVSITGKTDLAALSKLFAAQFELRGRARPITELVNEDIEREIVRVLHSFQLTNENWSKISTIAMNELGADSIQIRRFAETLVDLFGLERKSSFHEERNQLMNVLLKQPLESCVQLITVLLKRKVAASNKRRPSEFARTNFDFSLESVIRWSLHNGLRGYCTTCKDTHCQHLGTVFVPSRGVRLVRSVKLDSCIDASPLVVEWKTQSGETAIVSYTVAFSGMLCAFEHRGGVVLWQHELDAQCEAPCVLDSKMTSLLVPSGPALVQLDARLGTRLRVIDLGASSRSVLLCVGSLVFIGLDDGRLCHVDDRTNVQCTTRVDGSIRHPLLFHDILQRVFFVGSLGVLGCVDANARNLWQRSVELPVSEAVLHNDTVWLSSGSSLRSFHCSNGEPKQTVALGSVHFAPPLVEHQLIAILERRVVLIHGDKKEEHALDLDARPTHLAPATLGSHVLVFAYRALPNSRGFACVIERESGKCAAQFEFEGEVFSQATLLNGTAFFGCRDEWLYALEFETQTE